MTADLSMGTPVAAIIPPAAGKICYSPSNPSFTDCVSWGGYTGTPGDAGIPYRQLSGGLTLGDVAVRRTARGSKPCALDANKLNGGTPSADDNNDSATDFMAQPGDPDPHSNASAPQSVRGCARVVDGNMVFDAADGVENNVEFQCLSTPLCGELRDGNDDITAGDGCWQENHDKVVCPAPTLISAKLNGHDKRDKLDAAVDDVPTTLIGGDGNDKLFAIGTAADTLKGGAGNDQLDAADFTTGNDFLYCGSGDDRYAVDTPPDTKKGCEKPL